MQIDYQTAVMISQVCPNRDIDELADLLKKMGIVKKISSSDKEKIARRLELAKNWAEKYAPEEMKIKLNEEPQAIELTESEKKAVSSLADSLDKEDLQTVIYQTAKENGIEPKRFFQILYNIMINRDSGPRLGPFIIAVGIDRVRKLLDKVR